MSLLRITEILDSKDIIVSAMSINKEKWDKASSCVPQNTEIA